MNRLNFQQLGMNYFKASILQDKLQFTSCQRCYCIGVDESNFFQQSFQSLGDSMMKNINKINTLRKDKVSCAIN